MSHSTPHGSGPLAGVRIVELSSIGPAPFAVMMLADLGAEVIRVERPGGHAGNPLDPCRDLLSRGRRSIELDLKRAEDLDLVKRMIASSHILVEGYRPGVLERLGLGPEECLSLNPRLIVGRMTGWGQSGPLAERAGHDINYISLSGALSCIGPADGPPTIPSNMVGDFGGGSMLLVAGVLAAFIHAQQTGEGQVVDTTVLEGSALLTTMQHAFAAQGLLRSPRGDNLLDGGAHFYQVYETADGRYLSVGALEPPFYAAFVAGLGEQLSGDWAASHTDRDLWPRMKTRVSEIIASRPLSHWLGVFDGTDACVTPVLTIEEAAEHPQNVARGTFSDTAGMTVPGPTPRFSRTPLDAPESLTPPGQETAELRAEFGGT